MSHDLTVHEKLLLAAAELEASGKPSFSAEDLVVAAWRRYPHTFGLVGYTDEQGRPLYPNSNRVFVEIMGSKPIRKRGLIAKSGTKTFRLTESGRQRATALGRKGGGQSGAVKAAFPRETMRELRKILSSRALAKHSEGRAEDLTFHDASSFWGISARSSAKDLSSRIADVEGVLKAAVDAAAEQPIVLEHGSRPYTQDDLDTLLDLHHYMLERFEAEIAVIRKRTDERV